MDLTEIPEGETFLRHPWELVRGRFFADVLRPLLSGRAVTLLDAGAGDGWFAQRLADEHPSLSVICFDPGYVGDTRPANSDGRVTYVATQPPGPFGVITLLDVLEHVEDDAAALKKIAALLSPGGLAVVLVPAIPALYGPRDRSEGHFRRYSARRLRAAMEGAGLRVATMRAWNLTSLPLVLAFEKVLRRNIYDDGARYMGESTWKRLANEALAATLHVERVLPVPIGLSLLAVGELPAGDRQEGAAPA